MGDAVRPRAESRSGQSPVAIIGMACRLPGNSNSPQSLWNLLEQGGCASTGAPGSRFNLKGHYDGSQKPNTLRAPGAMFLENIDLADFDAQFFSIPKQEAIAMDPQQRQLLEVVYECLENAGVTMEALNGAPVGCFVASSTSDYRDIHARDPEDRPANATVGLVPAILSNRISHFLNLKGPSMTIDTACSASLVSLDVANKYMQAGEINTAIVAGVHLWLSPEANMDSGAMREAFSPSGKCHTFDAKADGYIKAEGVNTVLLKRFEDALRDGDPIRAVIRGSATNSDGRTQGIANPCMDAQADAIRAAYANAGISDLTATSFLECHGTGTLAGDPVEVQAASSVLCLKRGEAPLIIGSIKSNIGHSECSAGVSGIIKTVLALEKGMIPGNPTFITPNPRIDFQGLRVRASRTALPWPKVPLRRASVNSFGFGGSNAHVILEEAKIWAKPTHVSSFRSPEELDDFFTEDEATSSSLSVLVFSAKDETSLASNIDAVGKHLLFPAVRVDLQDLAFTLSERRTHHSHRAFIVTNKPVLDARALVTGRSGVEVPRIGFVFTGQGAQWPQMGKLLVQRFPLAKKLLCEMDSVLQHSRLPPSWSLLNELTEPRSPEILRQPAFSQPLTTALQIVIIEIFKLWHIHPQAVVGHSSGEIAAAYCAGHLSIADAIKAAFYRGQAALQTEKATAPSQGMLAVDLGAQKVSEYLCNFNSSVEVACYNSPLSVTLSGEVGTLKKVKARLEADNHAARMLHVDLAYHSRYMAGISDLYKSLLDQDKQSKSFSQGHIDMFSSVSGRKLDRSTDSAYWQTNMASPVYFDRAVQEMTRGRDGTNFLIEIGPSSTLASPISEIEASLAQKSASIQYCTAFQRGQQDLKSLFEVAGRLFISGTRVDMLTVNQNQDNATPRVIIDLPNYVWNHNTRYWHESEASKDWRFRLFPPHDLIGSKVLGTPWHTPVWKKDLNVNDIPWLKDHKLGSDIVVPGAAMVVIAVEAMSQLAHALHDLESKPLPSHPCYRVRNATFSRALVLEEGKRQTIQIVLAARTGSRDSWYEFKVHSLATGSWVEHSRGLVRVEEDRHIVAPEDALRPMVNSIPGALWYQAMEDVGYSLGPAFQKHLEAESLSGTRTSRSILSLREPPSIYTQSRYHMHPTSVDAILQVCAPALWNGNRTNINTVIVPAAIDELLICSQPRSTVTGMAVVSASFVGIGDPNETKNYTADAEVYDMDTGVLLFRLSKLHTSILNTHAVSHYDPIYCSLRWKPDIDFLFQKVLGDGSDAIDEFNHSAAIPEILDLIAFKTPNLDVYEGVMVLEDPTSLWLDNVLNTTDLGTARETFQLSHVDAKALLAAQERYVKHSHAAFALTDMSNPSFAESLTPNAFDLVIARMQSPSYEALHTTIQNGRRMLREGGYFLLLEYNTEGPRQDEGHVLDKEVFQTLATQCFHTVLHVAPPTSSTVKSAYIATEKARHQLNTAPRVINLLHFLPLSDAGERIVHGIEDLGWKVVKDDYPFRKVELNGTILVLDDLVSPLLSTIQRGHWNMLQALCKSNNKILWLTEGSQLEVTKPENAQIHGLMRTIRDEDPSINFTTLDLEDSTGPHTIRTINAVLEFLQTSTFRKTGDYEFAERHGKIHISRVLPDHIMNSFTKAEREGAELALRPFYDTKSHIRLVCERVGNLGSLEFHEISQTELSLQENEVEIEVAAAGLNFKDIAISTGLIPGNERLLGFEGAGTIRRSRSRLYSPQQRVIFTKAGAFANRVVTKTDLVHQIPDPMSFEEAATMGAVFPVAIYSLFDLANTRKGQRVLIHSAAGGVGIACIQLCRFLGADVYATVGNDEKRKFLLNALGVDTSKIFNSRSTSFAAELMKATNGEGVDVIINSLTGDLLEESWNCIRDGGTMVELGKRDIIERNYLPMEPFSRNVSYRSFDISHKSVSSSIMSRLLKQVFSLLQDGHIKPITPVSVFSINEITSAFRYMRDGKHMGKIVVSNGSQFDTKVNVRPALQRMQLRQDVAYLVVGGLKGLCGSLILSFARHGARHLIAMGRSGFDDRASQTVIRNVEAEGCKLYLMKGDVTSKADVQRVFNIAAVPVGGIVQGAMVVRGKLYQTMTVEDYHVAVACKIQGTWNLHDVALKEKLPLDFFSILSSTSGVAGQSGQANYVAANAFLDAFANYRRSLGLKANSIALGPVWDVGYMSRNKDSQPQTNTSTFNTISEALFHKIVEYSVLQQVDVINEESAAHLITGMMIPLKESSTLRVDARFSGLFGSATNGSSSATKGVSKEKQISNFLQSSQADPKQALEPLIELVGRQLGVILRLEEPIEPAHQLSSYGMESLAAVELRNWLRMELRADVTMLEIMNASSLITLCERTLAKMQPST